ncbi:elongation of very long chain fatty acids protein [Plakobranchus ocellatus]|uniref:Elongation of very long chain fatty acids protein n=1 Tax=Plakobranchus ocellatus TaxID=259542 RepID=A0AAV4BLC9_9GAST|nr:elongation of very long chain fatty acids protein [Plakobranchus ocellatus]
MDPTKLYEHIMSKRDTRVDQWMFMSSPFPTILVVLVYLISVTQGPKWMANFKPLNLKNLLVVYNFGLVLLSVYMVFEFIMSSWTVPNFNLSCEPVDYSETESAVRLLKVIWWYYFSKIIELLDTVFFVLRKKNSQISFLHVFHHSTMPLLWWICARFVAGGEAYFSATLNSGIHVLMYTYYMLSAMGPAMQPYLWWKKYMTSLQLMQFGLVLVKTIGVIYLNCGYPVVYAYMLVAYMLTLISLFSNFYYQTYLKNARNKRKQLKEANGFRDHETSNGHGKVENGLTITKLQNRKIRRFD